MQKTYRYFALIAAAGVGARMGSGAPKQYLRMGQRTMLEHSITAMLADARVVRVFIAVAPADDHWRALRAEAERTEFLPVGGDSRAHTVRNALAAIAGRVHQDDRVLVHDAARPCLDPPDLARLIDQVGDDDRGGLLALPVADTLKRGEDGHVVATVARDGLWCAQTPQMFRFESLRAALDVQSLNGVTDEASAVERNGSFPMLVHGRASNIKVTTAEDFALACAILALRESAQ
ncbi:MAG: 2-C-methyl-D-erythritol 4-phosphate cytidylyltransferase [Burkholderiaceae bacterium]